MRSIITAATIDMKVMVIGRRSHTSVALLGSRWYQEEPRAVSSNPMKTKR